MSNKLTETSYPSKLSSKGFNHLSAETCKHMRNKFQCSMHTKWRKKPIFLYLHFIWQKVGHWQHCLLKACIWNLRRANLSLWSIHPSMGVRMKQTARIHHRKATSFFFLSGPGIVSLASSLILVNKPTGLNRKKTPTRPLEFQYLALYPLSIRKRISPHEQFYTLSEIHWTVMHKHY